MGWNGESVSVKPISLHYIAIPYHTMPYDTIHMDRYTDTCIQRYAYIHTFLYIYYIFTYVRVHTYAYTSTWYYIYIYVYMCIHIYICTHITCIMLFISHVPGEFMVPFWATNLLTWRLKMGMHVYRLVKYTRDLTYQTWEPQGLNHS